MRYAVIALWAFTFAFIYNSTESSVHIFWKLLYKMNTQVVFFLGVYNSNALVNGFQNTGISNLSAAFRVERCVA